MSIFHKDKSVYINQVAIRVVNIENSINFYKDVLGFEIIDEEDGIGLGINNRVLLRLKQAQTPKQIRAAGLYHIAYLVPNRADLANWLYFHINNNTSFDGASNHGVSEAIYFKDIDGNGIEVYTDTPNISWEWNENKIHMITEALDIDDLFTEVTEPTNRLPNLTIIGHIHLSVLDIKKSQVFYNILGFDTVANIGSAAFLSSQQYHHHLGMNIWGMSTAKQHIKTQSDIDYFVIQYPSENELKNVLKKLDNNGFQYLKHPNYISIVDNNGIELHLVF